MSEHRRAAAGSAPAAGSSTPGRRAQRLAAARRRRRRLRLVAAGVTLLVAVGASTAALTLLRSSPAPVATAAEPVRSQRTLLLQVLAADGTASASALLAADPGAAPASASVLLVPGRVLAPTPGSGTVPFARTAALADPESSRRALADLAEVTVDAGWVLSAEGLTVLVDSLGGIVVDVDREVTLAQPDGTALVLAPAGPRQRLTGAVALAHLEQRAEGESELARMPRLQHVLDGLLAELPTTPDAVAGLLDGFGTGSATTGDGADVAGVLAAAAAVRRDGAVATDTLPVLPVDAGGAEQAFRLDPAALAPLLARRLAGSRPATVDGDRPRVLVLNGVGTPGLGSRARDLLVEGGLAFAGSANAGTLDHPESLVLLPDSSSASRALGARVADALGLPATAVRVERRSGSTADVVVVLGSDFGAGPVPPQP